MNFQDFGLQKEVLEAIPYMGFEKPTPIQELAIPPILEGNDLMASAQTGTGKTAAFILPILDKISTKKSSGTSTLIIVPTRELAMQIDQQIEAIAYFTSAHSIAIYGGGDGMDYEQEKKALKAETDIIVATPGKLKTHINMGNIVLKNLKHLILDEADRMLDIGFYADIMAIISALPQNRQTLLFSATMPPEVKKLAKEILKNPVEVKTEISKPAEGILQATYLTYDNQKIPLIVDLVKDKPEYGSILIFTSTKKKVQEIVKALKNAGGNVQGISSDLEQKSREEVLQQFKSRKIRILVATDIVSRGIDVKDINLVINFDVPQEAEDYVHRVGRTARASATGVAITLINTDDMNRFARIEKLIEREIIRIPLPPDLGKGPEWKTGSTSTKKRYSKPKHGKRKDRRYKTRSSQKRNPKG